ncbi:MAG: hypothetical protein ABW352_18565 [Polyangiales bacterium]
MSISKWAPLLALGACSWTMAQPLDVLSISDELPVKNRSSFSGALANESFQLGSYSVAEVDRKWNSTESASFFGIDAARTVGGYAYKFLAGGTQLKGECATEDSKSGKDLGGGWSSEKTFAKLGCRCSDSQGAVTLTVGGGDAASYEGAVTSPDVEYKVQAITQRTKGPSSREPLGWRIDSNDAPLGAVDLKRPGLVWISRSVEGRQREDLACLFAGLLLYLPKSSIEH